MSSTEHRIVELLKSAGLYDLLVERLDLRKDSPAVGDVHQTSAGSAQRRRKPKPPATAIESDKGFVYDDILDEDADDEDTGVEDLSDFGKRAEVRRLKPIDEATSHTPFSHDADALGKLRPDQVPRFFGAMTDPGKLERRTVRLNSLHSMQNRVDHGKVESMRQANADGSAASRRPKPPVVVRVAGKNMIADGHHRLAAQWLDGAHEAEVAYKDLSAHDNSLKRDDTDSDGDLLKAWSDEARDAAAAARARGGGAHGGSNHNTGAAMGGKSSAELSFLVARANQQMAGTKPGGAAHTQAQRIRNDAQAELNSRTSKRADFSIGFAISKTDPDHRLVFGWASIAEKNGQLVIDKQEDVILPADLEQAAYDYVLKSREMDDMHGSAVTGRMVESMVFTKEKQQALGIHGMLKNAAGEVIDTGWWCGWYADDDKMWAAIKSGARVELSIGGMSDREAL